MYIRTGAGAGFTGVGPVSHGTASLHSALPDNIVDPGVAYSQLVYSLAQERGCSTREGSPEKKNTGMHMQPTNLQAQQHSTRLPSIQQEHPIRSARCTKVASGETVAKSESWPAQQPKPLPLVDNIAPTASKALGVSSQPRSKNGTSGIMLTLGYACSVQGCTRFQQCNLQSLFIGPTPSCSRYTLRYHASASFATFCSNKFASAPDMLSISCPPCDKAHTVIRA